MSDEDKIRENRLRRMATRQGLRLTKSRRRDERALDFGRYWLSDVSTNGLVVSESTAPYGLDLDDVERYLTGDER